MTDQEMEGLWALLEIYYPGSPKLRDRKLRAAWKLVLEPYPPEDVKQALLTHLRGSRNFPFVQELAMTCPQPQGAVPAPTHSHTDRSMERQARWSVRYHQRLEEQLRARGLPSEQEAKEQGENYVAWSRRVEAAGIDTGQVLAETWATVLREETVKPDGADTGPAEPRW